MTIKFSIIIPCYNEARNLPELISQLNILSKRDVFEFIIVNNGSKDATSEILASSLSAEVKVINLTENAGYGGGIKSGLSQACGEYVGWIHADLQYSLLDSLMNLQNTDKKLVFIKGRRIGRGWSQNFLSSGMSLFESLLFGRVLTDINAQPTVFHKSLLRYAVNLPDDFSIDLYIFVTARKFGFEIVRFNVDFSKRKFGESSWNTGIPAVLRMIFRTVKYSFELRKRL